MISKSQQINGMFKAFALTDIDTSTVKTKQAAITTKKTGDPGQYIGWPKVSFEGKQYHLSTHMAGVIAKMDAENNGVPSNSPSNKTMKVDGCVLADGTPISIGIDDANDLNGAGISTMLSFIGGPRAWGNRTAAYPEETDMKDVFIVAKRMMFWINNWIITDTWNDVDSNITKRFVEAVTSKHNMRLNGLTSAGAILGGKCIFNPDENQAGQLIDGKIKFGLSVGFAGVAENIEFSIEIDPSYLEGISL
jgi:phage tail sheath protein FI